MYKQLFAHILVVVICSVAVLHVTPGTPIKIFITLMTTFVNYATTMIKKQFVIITITHIIIIAHKLEVMDLN